MVYWKYIRENNIEGGRVNQKNIEKILNKIQYNNQIIITRDNTNYHWKHEIHMPNGEWIWIKCVSQKTFENIDKKIQRWRM